MDAKTPATKTRKRLARGIVDNELTMTHEEGSPFPYTLTINGPAGTISMKMTADQFAKAARRMTERVQ